MRRRRSACIYAERMVVMLVLSRRKGESVVVGGSVIVTVLRIQSGRVRLGIAAPRRTPVHRHEVLESVTQDDHEP